MSEPNPFGEKREGLLARLLKRAAARPNVKTVVHRQERVDLVVPAAKADVTRAAVEQWFASQGISAALIAEDAGDGKTRLRAELGESDATKLDLTSGGVQDELEQVLTRALSADH